ncbi:alpha/beta hydrolase-fold protein [Gimesia sp.]|uniref:alpha/beta hydrolase n=1 Tax=Gimesia sp. TaxID=2024833 RepID=UPI0032EE663F
MTPAPQVMTSAAGDYSRNLWLVPGPRDSVHPLCLFLDAEHYLRDMDCLPLISKLMAGGQIPPLTLAFVSHVSSEDRQRDYLWNPRYAQFLAEEVVPWVCARSHARAEGNLICGLSLSGLAAAHVAFQYPGLFSQVLCQSGSFWWLAQQELELPVNHARFWLSVGDQETETEVTHPPSGLYQEISQIEGVEWAAAQFQDQGATVQYQQYKGGHAIAPWRAELPAALCWLLAAQQVDNGVHSQGIS